MLTGVWALLGVLVVIWSMHQMTLKLEENSVILLTLLTLTTSEFIFFGCIQTSLGEFFILYLIILLILNLIHHIFNWEWKKEWKQFQCGRLQALHLESNEGAVESEDPQPSPILWPAGCGFSPRAWRGLGTPTYSVSSLSLQVGLHLDPDLCSFEMVFPMQMVTKTTHAL